MNPSTSSSYVWVPFHQVDNLQNANVLFRSSADVFFVASKLEKKNLALTLIMASGWKSTSPSRASKNVFSALTFTQHLVNQPFQNNY